MSRSQVSSIQTAPTYVSIMRARYADSHSKAVRIQKWLSGGIGIPIPLLTTVYCFSVLVIRRIAKCWSAPSPYTAASFPGVAIPTPNCTPGELRGLGASRRHHTAACFSCFGINHPEENPYRKNISFYPSSPAYTYLLMHRNPPSYSLTRLRFYWQRVVTSLNAESSPRSLITERSIRDALSRMALR